MSGSLDAEELADPVGLQSFANDGARGGGLKKSG